MDCHSTIRSFLPLCAVAALSIMNVSLADATWIDAATGEPVHTIPINRGVIPQGDMSTREHADAQYLHNDSNALSADPNHAQDNGRNLVWVPCPPPPAPAGINVLPLPLPGFGLSIGGHRDRRDDRSDTPRVKKPDTP